MLLLDLSYTLFRPHVLWCLRHLMNKNTKVLLHLPRPAGCSDVMWRCDVMPWRHMTSRHHAMTSHDVMTSHHKPVFGICSLKSENSGNYVFDLGDLDLWPMTLTIELIQGIIEVNPCIKYRDHMSNGLAMRALTDRQTHTHRPTADAGGKNQWFR